VPRPKETTGAKIYSIVLLLHFEHLLAILTFGIMA
jgi:hypothetical protein